jgi:Cu-Zn family superoxide dismutase
VQGGFTLVNQGSAISIRGEITGLSPGKEHGFHLHEVGECSLPNFESAGGHYNPTQDPHGGPESDARHLGDLPNAKADEDGRATISVDVEGVTLVDKDGAPSEILGKAIVVHAMPDDYKTQPSGGSGDRIACGVIR